MNRKLTNDINNYLFKFSTNAQEIINNSQKYKYASSATYNIHKNETSKFYIVGYDSRIKNKFIEYMNKSFPNVILESNYDSINDIEKIIKNLDPNLNNKLIFFDDNPIERSECEQEDEINYADANFNLYKYLKEEFKYQIDLFFTSKVRLYLGGVKEIKNELGGIAKINRIDEYAGHTIDYYYNLVDQIFPSPNDLNKHIKVLLLCAPHNYDFLNMAKNALKSKINNIEIYDRRDMYIYSLSFIDEFNKDDFVIVDGESIDQFIYLAKIIKIGLKCTVLFSSKTIYAYTKGIIDTYQLDIKAIFLNSFPDKLFSNSDNFFNFHHFLNDANKIFYHLLPNYIPDTKRKFATTPLNNESLFIIIPILAKTVEAIKHGYVHNFSDNLKLLNSKEKIYIFKEELREKYISKLINLSAEKKDVFMILLETFYFAFHNYEKGLKLEYKDFIDKIRLYKEDKNENLLAIYIQYSALVLSFLRNF